jgi:hypothetical protein
MTMTNGSSSATVASASGLAVGMYVSHPKYQSGTQIVAISGTTLTMSHGSLGAATASGARFSPLLDAQTMGATGGSLMQTNTLVTANLPAYTPSGGITVSNGSGLLPTSGAQVLPAGGASYPAPSNPGPAVSATFTGNPQGGTSTPFTAIVMQPTVVMNYIIKR